MSWCACSMIPYLHFAICINRCGFANSVFWVRKAGGLAMSIQPSPIQVRRERPS